MITVEVQKENVMRVRECVAEMSSFDAVWQDVRVVSSAEVLKVSASDGAYGVAVLAAISADIACVLR
jgi:hypothetical protein